VINVRSTSATNVLKELKLQLLLSITISVLPEGLYMSARKVAEVDMLWLRY